MLKSQVEGRSCFVGPGTKVGKGSRVLGTRVWIGSDTTIGDDVVIEADEVRIGSRCRIERGVESGWRGGNARIFVMGDCCFLGHDSRILVREFRTGDYVVLHNHLLANGDAELSIGHNAWMGQNGIMNANAAVTIGNNVGIGAYSAIWTHGKFGALIDGCLMHKEAPVAIEDDACLWRAVVSPGVTVGRRATVLPGSVLTKDAPAGSCFGGVPADDLSSKVKTYRKVTLEEQFSMMGEFVKEFLQTHYRGRFSGREEGDYLVSPENGVGFRILVRKVLSVDDLRPGERTLAVTIESEDVPDSPEVSVFDLKGRTYTKRLSDPEVEFMWFLNDSRARFVPMKHHPSGTLKGGDD